MRGNVVLILAQTGTIIISENSFIVPGGCDTKGVIFMSAAETIEPEVIPRPGYLDMQDPLEEGFDWVEFRRALGEKALDASFLVLFGSELLETLSSEDKALLASLDTASHIEAQQSDALLKYFAGNANESGRALSWCLWTDRKAAANALHGPSHKQAIRLAREGKFYNNYTVKFYGVLPDDEKGFTFIPIRIQHEVNIQQEETPDA
jgi:hypothetical protein